ncbi:AmpG family muropeptide MFS transporter [Govanella unica]|uniref:AmpG family muropeptide MFS transporter n=1 Tax=Govanella unica TaxID=2975056 RepID=A0A9X3TZL2_9PROT|nr:AmpG family muropeptide MFS transporter [Govania unica]MDA5194669.1 AmpG family muropeptide MFS transporter [Govania unica]
MAEASLSRLKHALAVYGDRRVLSILLFGFSSGLPLALTGSTLSVWLADIGVSLKTIGFFAAVAMPYALKFLWAPLVDRVRLPGLAPLMGHRRSWMLVTQLALMAAIVALGNSVPQQEPMLTAALAVLVAFLSATQDIVIDAYRVEILRADQYAAGAAMVQFGYRMGMLVSGAGALFLADRMPWGTVFAIVAVIQAVGVVAVLMNPEPAARGAEDLAAEAAVAKRVTGRSSGLAAWLYVAVVAPFHEFMTRNGVGTALLILAFIVFYKFGDALAGSMTNPFLIKLGFTKSEIAEVVKLFGLVATLAGLALGGVMIRLLGLFRALMICGVLQLLSNLMFVAQATVGADIGFLALTIAVENLAGGMGSAVFVAYLSGLCNLAFTATQYALLSSLAVVGRTVLSTGGGAIAEAVGWVHFFMLTSLAAVPGLLLLLLLRRAGMGLRTAQ